MSDYSNLFCIQPWSRIDVYLDGGIYYCCPSWVGQKCIGNLFEQSWQEIWNGDIIKEARQGMHDGTFKHCIDTECPHLKETKFYEPVYERNNIEQLYVDFDSIKDFRKIFENREVHDNTGPTSVVMSYDQSCNLQCPTCRPAIQMITPKNRNYDKMMKLHEIVTEEVITHCDMVTVAGSGDAFGSPLFRDFLRNFEPSKYPNINYVHPMTNALLWDSKMWDSMKSVQPYVKTAYISVDAITSETYNKVRTLKPSHGNFEQLVENLKFINTIPTLETIVMTYTVSNMNYHEVDRFFEIKQFLPDKDIVWYFYKVNDWGHFGNKLNDYSIHNVDHPNHQDFLIHWKKCLENGKNQRMRHTLQGIKV